MIKVDIHSHIYERHHWADSTIAEIEAAYGNSDICHCPPDEHWEQVAEKVERVAVFAMMMNATGLVVPNEYVHEYVSQHPEKLIGVASVDPNEPECIEQLEHAVKNLGFRALKLSGAYQDFNPADSRYDPLYRKAQDLDVPIFWHQSTTALAATPLRWSKPILLDEVAQRFPDLRQMICHIGHPWHTDAPTPTCRAGDIGACASTRHWPRQSNMESDTRSCSVPIIHSPKSTIASNISTMLPAWRPKPVSHRSLNRSSKRCCGVIRWRCWGWFDEELLSPIPTGVRTRWARWMSSPMFRQ